MREEEAFQCFLLLRFAVCWLACDVVLFVWFARFDDDWLLFVDGFRNGFLISNFALLPVACCFQLLLCSSRCSLAGLLQPLLPTRKERIACRLWRSRARSVVEGGHVPLLGLGEFLL